MEEGTEAAAATAVVMTRSAMSAPGTSQEIQGRPSIHIFDPGYKTAEYSFS